MSSTLKLTWQLGWDRWWGDCAIYWCSPGDIQCLSYIIIFSSSTGHINDQLSSSVIIFFIWPHQSFKIDNNLFLLTLSYFTCYTVQPRHIFIDMYQIEYYSLVLLCVLYAEVKPEPANDGFLWSLWLMNATVLKKKISPKISFSSAELHFVLRVTSTIWPWRQSLRINRA